MAKILIVEDEEKLARFLELELSHEGYAVAKAGDGRTGLTMAESGGFDLIVLDIMLPELSGLELLRRLRRTSSVPVILLTARGAVTDKVSGLDMGANDYITKPFAIEELLARIRVLLRPRTEESAEDDHILRGCGIEMNTLSHAVTYAGAPVELTNREFVLLKTLLTNRNIAMTREQLLETAWGYDYMGETNVVDVYVRYIRQKTADNVITTIRGVGYMIKTE
ncbi:MAG: response regulator transcription factor [Eubacteriales bacterium]|nr:response regulator transcription factor [Clostridiales bacterium]MDD7773397.1 response regulator transcription factor [Eubacteriales bacterium]MDY3942312.1 response regulator transcription factor [Eubacteriales bacterium]